MKKLKKVRSPSQSSFQKVSCAFESNIARPRAPILSDPYADPKNSLLPSKLYACTFFNYQMNSFIFNATLFETSKLGINTFRQGCRDLVSRNSFPRAIVL